MLSGFGEKYFDKSYFDDAPGFAGEAVSWLFDRRGIRATGADTFGPDATADEDFLATLTTLQKGGITVENVGPGLKHMRAHGDWININGGRPRYSGFQMGITGFTIR
jgi:kynurenine formamidase